MSFILFAAAVAAPVANVPVAPVARGYETQMTASGLLCLRPTTAAESERLGVPTNSKECQPVTRWEDEGLHIERVAES